MEGNNQQIGRMTTAYQDSMTEDTAQAVNRPKYAQQEKYQLEKSLVELTHAGFGIRLAAFLIDLIIIGCIKGMVINPLAALTSIDKIYFGFEKFSMINIISAFVYFAYFILMTYFFSATLGKMIFKLKVISEHHQKLTLMDILTRELFGRFISDAILRLPYLVILFNPSHRGIHDLLSDSIVIREEKEKVRNYIINEGIRI